MLVVHRDADGELEIAVTGPVLVDSDEQARGGARPARRPAPCSTAPSSRCPTLPVAAGRPLRRGARAPIRTSTATPSTTCGRTRRSTSCCRACAGSPRRLPEAPSHMLWMNWVPADPGRSDRRARTWPTASRTTPTSRSTASGRTRRRTRRTSPGSTDRMREMEHLATGIQLADENLGQRPARFVSDANLRRLDQIRARVRPRRSLSSVDGPARDRAAMSDRRSTAYLARPVEPPQRRRCWRRSSRARSSRPTRSRAADLDRLLDPAPLAVETGWCTLPDGVGYVAVRTPMPGVSGEMVDWWFDWHPRDAAALPDLASDRPSGQLGRAAGAGGGQRPTGARCTTPSRTSAPERSMHGSLPRADASWGSRPTRSTTPTVATIVCGYVGRRPAPRAPLADGPRVPRRRRRRRAAQPLLARRGAAPLPARRRSRHPAAWALNNRVVRRLALPPDLPRALARHCAEEYANLAVLLPELHARFGP